jgi:hypothetical protein
LQTSPTTAINPVDEDVVVDHEMLNRSTTPIGLRVIASEPRIGHELPRQGYDLTLAPLRWLK